MYDARLIPIYLHEPCLHNLIGRTRSKNSEWMYGKRLRQKGTSTGGTMCGRGGTDIGSPSIVFSTGEHRECTIFSTVVTVHPHWRTQPDPDTQGCARFTSHRADNAGTACCVFSRISEHSDDLSRLSNLGIERTVVCVPRSGFKSIKRNLEPSFP